MNAIKKIGMMLVFSLTLLAFGCGGNSEAAADAHGTGKEYTSAYVCPMHCEGSGSEEMGQCPVCGMDYVAQADHVENGHSH